MNNFANKSNVISLNTNLYNEELTDIHKKLHTFILKEFKQLFTDEVYHHFPTILGRSDNLFDSYFSGVGVWSITNTQIDASSDDCIYDLFLRINESSIKHKRTLNTFKLWRTAYPTAFEVDFIDPAIEFATITDLLTQEIFQVRMNDKQVFTVGDLVIGALVPYVGYHEFLIEAIHLNNIDTFILEDLLNDYNPMLIGTEHFPYFLKHVLEVDNKKGPYFNDNYEVIAQLITMEMHTNDYELWVVTMALSIWELFCKTYKPVIKNVDTYVAAIEYFSLQEFMDETPLPINEFAKMYNIPVRGFKDNYEKIKALFTQSDNETEHEIDTVIFSEFPSLYLVDSKE